MATKYSRQYTAPPPPPPEEAPVAEAVAPAPEEPLRIGIEAGPLLEAQYGMGRYLRAFLMELSKDPTLEVVLVAPKDTREILKKRFVNTKIKTALPSEILRYQLNAVWHPWGNISFPCDAPVLLSLHDFGVYGSPPEGYFPARKAKKAFEKQFRKAARIAALSNWSAGKISSTLDIDPTTIITAPPLPDSSWSPGDQELKRDSLGECPFVLTVGGWQKHHDMKFAIEMHHKAFGSKEIKLVICGTLDDDGKAELEKLPHHHHISTPVDDGELRGLYRNAKVVINTATKSHWSSVAAEALCCGTPVMASDSTCLPQIVGKAGFCIPMKDKKSWPAILSDIVFDEGFHKELKTEAIEKWGKSTRKSSIEELTKCFKDIALID